MLLSGIHARSELDPRLEHSGVTPFGINSDRYVLILFSLLRVVYFFHYSMTPRNPISCILLIFQIVRIWIREFQIFGSGSEFPPYWTKVQYTIVMIPCMVLVKSVSTRRKLYV